MRFKAIAFAALFAAACGPTAVDRGDDSEDRGASDLNNIQQQPNSAVCAGGRFHCFSRVRTDAAGKPKANAGGLTASDLAAAYKLNTALKPNATIAIVDAYGYSAAESDLAQYRSQMGLSACTTANGCLKIVNQNGQASPLPSNPPAGDDWTVETALDLDMASAACPNCKLLLIQAQDDQGDGLYVSNDTAAALGATVVSNSWGGPEQSGVSSEETHFNHAGIAFFVASGDSGYDDGQGTPDYPSTSAHTVAVGGTSLTKSASGTRGWTEGAWSDGGSSCSTNIAKPSWQLTSVCTMRATSDVAAVGDPNTGPAIYNAANGGMIVVGGTSAASPFVAAVYALYGHGGEAPGWAESHATDFFDVTTGTNGTCGTIMCKAGAGWDGPTGMGTPNGTALGGTTTCTPNCTGKTCGDDGCGGSCGSCPSGDSCVAGTCEAGQGSGSGSGSGSGGNTCDHPDCSTGDALTPSCDTCAGEICAQDSYCCTTAWDSICVGEAGSICNETCGGGGGGSTCKHNECNSGVKLKSGCDSCVTDICSQDPYCCKTKWDSVCVSETGSICGESCN
jgi:hypothetical protein